MQFTDIYIEKNSLESVSAKRVFELFSKDRIHIIKDKAELKKQSTMSAAQFNKSKKQLLLCSFKGKFFKRCPGVRPGLICCNYFILNLGQHCEMDCSYCYLQNLINFPYVTIYTNIQDALKELSSLQQAGMDQQKLRVGTGELTDSLSLDDISLHSAALINFFKRVPLWTLEFKTKSNNIKNFINLPHAGNVIVSWSLNPQYIIEREEHGTASLEERLQAARHCRNQGYLVAFHIDPVIYHPEWKENYQTLTQKITSLFKPKEVSHISLGALRFQPEQRHLMRERFGLNSLITQGEYFKSQDGKLRYDSQVRQKMFTFIHGEFKKQGADWPIFLCMEDKENWLSAIHQLPQNISTIKQHFDFQSVRAFHKHSSPAVHKYSSPAAHKHSSPATHK